MAASPCWIDFVFIYFLLTRNIVNGNNSPVFTGSYPVEVDQDEGTAPAAGSAFHTFAATDADAVDTVSLTFTFDPTSSYIMFDTTGGAITLATGRVLDYETQSVYRIYCSATDGVATTGPVLLTINVNDVGEAPTLNPATDSTFTIDESTSGTLVGTPSFTISDLDTFETHTFSIYGGTGTSYVDINSGTGAITLKVNYDREGAGIPANFYVDVKVVDKFTLSATTTYSVIVNDVNDNTPVFNPTTYAFSATDTTAVGTVMATLAATDADAESPNNALTYSIDPASTGSDYFEIDGADLKVKHTIDVANGPSAWTFNVIVTDGGSPALSATAQVTVSTTTTTTTTTTTILPPAGYSWFDDQFNVLMLIGVSLAMAILIGYALLLCWRCNTYGQCMPDQCPTLIECATCCDCKQLCCCKGCRDGTACQCPDAKGEDQDGEDDESDRPSSVVKNVRSLAPVVIAQPKPIPSPNPFENAAFVTSGRQSAAAPLATNARMKFTRF